MSLGAMWLNSSKKYRASYYVSLSSQLPWAYLGLKAGMGGLILYGVIATALNIRGLVKLNESQSISK
jgi:hypothetical protein